jgi:chloramphenicol-sensitive protein RarD
MSVLFAAYAAIRKKGRLSAIDSSFVEMVLAAPLAAAMLMILHAKGLLVFGTLSLKHDGLLLFSVIFFLPGYIMFNQAVKLVDLSLVGFLQYITPILQFIFVILFLREKFTWSMGACYLIIWVALVFFSAGTFRRGRSRAGER